MVVSKPISRMIIVEKELTTPLGIALFRVCTRVSRNIRENAIILMHHLRRKDRDEEQDCLRVSNAFKSLRTVEGLGFDPSLVTSNSLHRDESLARGKK